MRRRLEYALLPVLRLEHALLPRPRLEHALLRRLRLGEARFGAAEFQRVEEARAATGLGCWRRSIALALGFFRPRRRAANLLGGDAAANILGRDVERRAMLTPAAGVARRRRRRQRPIEDRIGLLRVGPRPRRSHWRPHSARGVLRQSGRALLRRLRRRTDVAARLGRAGLGRDPFGWLVPLARLTELRRRHP